MLQTIVGSTAAEKVLLYLQVAGDPHGLPAAREVGLAAIALAGDAAGLAALDASTGHFRATSAPLVAGALAPSLLPAGSLVAGGVPKDGIPALVDPPLNSAAELAEAAARSRRGKYLVDSDRVIGVEIAGAARAYPLRLLVWHEVANDVLGGRAIAVTYNPLCDSAVVFDRRVGGETLTLGVSGLLFNSNLLMYDRRSRAILRC